MADPIRYCGKFLPDFNWPDAGKGACCAGAADVGRIGCTCWEPVYDPPAQAPIRREQDATVMPRMCADCAYKPGSLERRDDPNVVASAQLLDDIVITGTPFWCHNGLPRITHYVHPATGVEYHPDVDLTSAYKPVIDENHRPYKADGSPADYCAGWSARMLRHNERVLRGESL
jgi:hypothetical protein